MVIGLKCAKKRGLWAGEQLIRPRSSRRQRRDQRQCDWIAMLEEGLLPQPVAEPLAFEDDFERPVVHRVVSAAGQPLPAALGPRSVFDLCAVAAALAAAEVVAEIAMEQAGQTQEAPERPLVTRDAGITRCAGAAYPSNRWTPEREEQERQRRARQKPPRPQKQKFKMKGTKVWADRQS